MGTHNVFDNNQCPCGPTNDPIVDKLLGNAYQVVKYVAVNMPAIKVVSDEIASILAVYAKLKELSDIQAKIPELMEIQAALPHLEVLHTNLVQLLTLYSHIGELVKVATGIDDIHTITPYLQELATVAASITEVVATGTNISKVIAVANSIVSVNKLAPVAAEIDTLAQNVQALVNINTHLPELLNIEHHLPDLLNIETPLSKLVINSFEALRRTYSEAGLVLVIGSFEDGANVTTKQDVVLERKTGKGYNWQGSIPSGGKIIPAGSTPASTGGIGADKWQDLSNITYANQREFTNGKQYTLYRAFEAAVTLTQVNEAVQFSAGGIFYRWDGAFPQGGLVIPQNTPEPAPDQTGAGKYIAVLDLEVMVKTTAFGTVADIGTGKWQVGKRVIVTDRANAIFEVVQGGVPDGLGILYAGANKTAILTESTAVPQFFGAKGDKIADDTLAVKAALAHASAKGINFLGLPGGYLCTSPIVLPEGIIIEGANAECYGEFTRSKSKTTLVFSGIPADTWALSLPVGSRPLTLRNIDVTGDWGMNGLSLDGSNREISFENVSLKQFFRGMRSKNCWVSTLDRLSISAIEDGLLWSGGGTTTKFDRLVVQGDKVGKRPLKRGITLGTQAAEFLHTTIVQNSAVQYVVDAICLNGNCSVKLDALDIEEVHGSIFSFSDTDNANVTIANVYLGATDESASMFKFAGRIGKRTTIELGSCNALSRFLDNDWRAVKFIDSSATFEAGASFLVNERWFRLGVGKMNTITPVTSGFLRVLPSSKAYSVGIMLSGSTTYTFPAAAVTNLYDGAMYTNPVDPAGFVTENTPNLGSGLLYKLTSHTLGSNRDPIVYYFALRRVPGDSYFQVKRVTPPDAVSPATDPIGISYSAGDDTITVTTKFTAQKVIIEKA